MQKVRFTNLNFDVSGWAGMMRLPTMEGEGGERVIRR